MNGLMSRPLVLACGALAGDLRAVLAAGGFDAHVDVAYLPANLHNRPDTIAVLLRPRLQAAIDARRPVFVAYADCGTGGGLDALLDEFPGVHRLPGAHCYEVFAGSEQFAAMHDEELGTFYLTDFLTKHFDALVWCGLGLDRHPELRETYFANYRRVVLLSQEPGPDVLARARDAAARLGLPFVHHPTGRDGLRAPVLAFVSSQQAHHAATR
ncbi:MAG: DUF1638 domain-containing protein [Actinomycetota bacterium]|nr:DUF1638 domain-containing protein [Actinomycetota bacterium]